MLGVWCRPIGMERLNTELVQLRIELRPEDGWSGLQAEALWAEPVSASPPLFLIRNVPFCAQDVSLGDIVEAEPRDGKLVFQRVAQRSGHSTYRLVLGSDVREPSFDGLWSALEEAGCRFEQAQSNWIALDVPPEADITLVRAILQQGSQQGLWHVEEAHCERAATRSIQ